jgi:hypothetical protein
VRLGFAGFVGLGVVETTASFCSLFGRKKAHMILDAKKKSLNITIFTPL